MWIAACIGLLAGMLFGWWLRSARQSTQTLMIDELYGRKLRLAESDREQAVRSLNENRVLMAGFDERFSKKDAEIAQLQADLAHSHDTLARVEAESKKRAQRLQTVDEEVERARKFADEALRECSEATTERDEAVGAIDGVKEDLAARAHECEMLEARIGDRDGEIVRLRGELAARDGRLAELTAARAAGERDLELTRHNLDQRTGEVAALGKLRSELETARRESAALSERVTARGAEIEALTRRVKELEPVPEQLRASQGEVATLRPQLVARSGEVELLTVRLGDREQEIARLRSELAAREQRLTDVGAARAAVERDLELTQRELERRTSEVDDLSKVPPELERVRRESEARAERIGECELEIESLAKRLSELEPLPEQLRATMAELAAERDAHQRREGELERAWSSRHESELRAKSDQLARLDARVVELNGVATEVSELRGRTAEVESLRALVERTTAQSETLLRTLERERIEAKAIAERANAAERRAEAAQAQVDVSARELAQSSKRVQGLEQKLEQVSSKLRESDERSTDRKSEAESFRKELAEATKALAALEAQHRTKESELEKRTARVEELETSVADLRERLTAARGPERDDLTAIAGIGPVIERKLQRMGLKTYRQLASLSTVELESLAQKLGLSVDRIRREGWVASARDELKRRNGVRA